MELKDMKEQLTINQVLQYYNLQSDKNQRLVCPFHPDKNPSLQICCIIVAKKNLSTWN